MISPGEHQLLGYLKGNRCCLCIPPILKGPGAPFQVCLPHDMAHWPQEPYLCYLNEVARNASKPPSAKQEPIHAIG